MFSSPGPLAPELNGTGFVRFTVQDLAILLDWSDTFRLNSILRHFLLIRDDIFISQGTLTSASLTGQPRGTSKPLVIMAILTYQRERERERERERAHLYPFFS